MTELDDRLRTGITALAERAKPTASPDDVVASLGRGSRRSPKIGMRVAVVAAVVLVVVAAVALVRRTEHQAVVDVGPSTTTPSEEWHPTGLAPGWHDLPLGPVDKGIAQGAVWTGGQLIVAQWGLLPFSSFPSSRPAAYDPRSSQWSELPPAPGADLHNLIAGGTWTGREAIFWRSRDIVAWNPTTQSWRTSAVPHDLQRGAVWTGDELIFWADGLAYDPTVDSWREIARPSNPLADTVNDDANSVLWFRDEVVVVGGLSGAYDPSSDTWREFGAPLVEEAGTPGIAFDGYTAQAAVIDGAITAFDASPASAAVLDLDVGTWTEVPALAPPIDPSGWLQVVPFDDGRVQFVGTDDAQLRGTDGSWSSFPTPSAGQVVGTGDAAFLYGERDGAPQFSVFVPYTPRWDLESLGSGWHEFDRGPLPADRAPLAVGYSELPVPQLMLFGLAGVDDVENRGFAFNPKTREWSEIPAAPLDSLVGLGGFWDGESLVVWSQSGVAYWDPENAAWRKAAEPPRSLDRPLWVRGNPALAGADLVYWADGLAYDMQRDEWREIATPPAQPTRSDAVFDGYELIVVGLASEQIPSETAQMAYDPEANSWRELPPSGLDGQALDLARRLAPRGSGRDDEIVGVDYRGNAASYYRPTNSWRPLGHIPLDTGEDDPQLVDLGSAMVVRGYSGFARLDDNDQWTVLRQEYAGGHMVPAGSAMFVLGAQLDVYVP